MTGPTDIRDRIIALLPRLGRFALTLTRNQDDADDLLQMTVERALVKLDRWQEDTRLDSWMFKIMQNMWIDQVRSRRVGGGEAPEVDLSDVPGDDGRAVTEARLTLRATLEAVMRLPEEQRSVLLLVVVEGFAYREAAEVLEVPVGTVMSRLARARMALQGQMHGGTAPRTGVRQ